MITATEICAKLKAEGFTEWYTAHNRWSYIKAEEFPWQEWDAYVVMPQAPAKLILKSNDVSAPLIYPIH